MTKRKPVYRAWRWHRYLSEGNDIRIHFLPVLSVGRQKGQWTIRIGWLKWIFAGELIKGYVLNYLGYDHE